MKISLQLPDCLEIFKGPSFIKLIVLIVYSFINGYMLAASFTLAKKKPKG